MANVAIATAGVIVVLGSYIFLSEQIKTAADTTSRTPTTATTTTVEVTESAAIDEYVPNEEDVEYIAKTLYGEARGIESDMEKAAVAWCILNRVDCDRWADTIEGVVTQPNQFHGYSERYPVTEELREIAEDVLSRWHNEKVTGEVDGRVLPQDYYFFYAIGDRNYFRQEYKDRTYWDWSMENPYED